MDTTVQSQILSDCSRPKNHSFPARHYLVEEWVCFPSAAEPYQIIIVAGAAVALAEKFPWPNRFMGHWARFADGFVIHGGAAYWDD